MHLMTAAFFKYLSQICLMVFFSFGVSRIFMHLVVLCGIMPFNMEIGILIRKLEVRIYGRFIVT